MDINQWKRSFFDAETFKCSFDILSSFQVSAMKCGLLPISIEALVVSPCFYFAFHSSFSFASLYVDKYFRICWGNRLRLNQSDVGFTQFCSEGEVLLFLEFLTKKCHMSGVVGYYSPRLSFRPLPCKLVIEWRICLKENILFGKICKVQVVCAMKIDASSSHYCSKNTVWIYHHFQITVWIRIQCICYTNHTNSLSSWKVRTIDYIFLSESTPGLMTLVNTGFVFLTLQLPRSR